jgi:hypothetical protein
MERQPNNDRDNSLALRESDLNDFSEPKWRTSVAPLSRGLCAVTIHLDVAGEPPLSRGLCPIAGSMAVAVEHQHSFRVLRRRVRFLENRAQADVVKRDRELMLFGKAFDLLLSLPCAHAPRPDARELRIVNCANLLFRQFSFNQVRKPTH